MAATKDECARSIKGVEQRQPMRTGRGDGERRYQEKRSEESEGNDTAAPGDREAQTPGDRGGFSLAEPKARACADCDRRDLPE